MCTIGRTPAGTAGKAHHWADQAGNPVRGGQGRTDCGSKRGRNSFLNTALAPIAQKSIVVDTYDGDGINVITRENYEFLRDSFSNYALLLKKEVVHTPGKSIGESIARLYDEMDELVGEGMNVNIEQNNGRLYFNLWKCHKWGELTLYYFPVKFLESISSTLRRISITFLHKLMGANGISTILDEEDTEYVFMWLQEEDSQEEEEETDKRLELVRSYEKGKIGRLLKHVEKKSYYKDLPKALEKYNPQNDFERSIVGAMKKGLPFLNPEHGIMQYGYDAFHEEEPEFYPMRLDQQIRVVYDCNDMVTDYLADYYNNNSRETYDIIPITTCALSPETDRLFIMDDYPERFFKWADEFINIVY